MQRTTALIAGGLALVCVAVGIRIWVDHMMPGTRPPVPERLDHLDASLAGLIRTAASKVEKSPASDESWRELAMIYFANGMLELASTCFEKTLGVNPHNVRARYAAAIIQSKLGDLDGAIVLMRHVIDEAPQYSPARCRLGSWLLDRGELESAEHEFAAAMLNDEHDAAAIVGLARINLNQQNNQRAADLLSRLVNDPTRRPPNEEYINQLLGIALRRLGRIEESNLAMSRSQQQRKPQLMWPDPWEQEWMAYRAGDQTTLQLAQNLMDQDRFLEAHRLLEPLVADQPDNLNIILKYSACLRGLNRIDEAMAMLDRAASIWPDSPYVHINIARCQLARIPGQDQAQAEALRDSAMEHVERALALNPALPGAHALRGEILAGSGQTAAAIAAYELAAKVCGEQAYWSLLIAKLQFDSQHWAAAVEAAEQVTALAPRNTEAWWILAAANMNMGQVDQARTALIRAAELSPENDQFRVALEQLNASSSGIAPRERP